MLRIANENRLRRNIYILLVALFLRKEIIRKSFIRHWSIIIRGFNYGQSTQINNLEAIFNNI